jgi:hypothetical protein
LTNISESPDWPLMPISLRSVDPISLRVNLIDKNTRVKSIALLALTATVTDLVNLLKSRKGGDDKFMKDSIGETRIFENLNESLSSRVLNDQDIVFQYHQPPPPIPRVVPAPQLVRMAAVEKREAEPPLLPLHPIASRDIHEKDEIPMAPRSDEIPLPEELPVSESDVIPAL